MKAGSWLAVLAFIGVALLVLLASLWIARWMDRQARPPGTHVESMLPPGAPCFAWVLVRREGLVPYEAWALCKLPHGHAGPHDPDA